MPAKFTNTSAILPPSVQLLNYVHDAGTDETASLDHDGIGAGSHSPGGIYTDEGSVSAATVGLGCECGNTLTVDRCCEQTNWNISHNVVANVKSWLAGCRAVISTARFRLRLLPALLLTRNASSSFRVVRGSVRTGRITTFTIRVAAPHRMSKRGAR